MRHPKTLKAKSELHTVTREGRGYAVTSGRTGNVYHVSHIPGRRQYTCTCKWSEYRPDENNGACGCSHVLAVIAFEQQEQERRLSAVHTTFEQATRQHRAIIDLGDDLLVTTRKA